MEVVLSSRNGNERVSKRQRKTRSEGQRSVYMRRHRGCRGWEHGRKRTEEDVSEKSAKSVQPPGWIRFHFTEFLIFMIL